MSDNGLLEILGSMARPIGNIFDLMEVAEDEIDRAKTRWPDRQEELHGSFMLLKLTPALADQSASKLYRLHCQEVLARVAEDQDTREGTKAEMMAVLSQLSLNSPLRPEATCLYGRLFGELFPSDADRIGDSDGVDLDALERLHGSEADVLAGMMAKKLYQKDRVAGRRLTKEYSVEIQDTEEVVTQKALL